MFTQVSNDFLTERHVDFDNVLYTEFCDICW